MMAAAGARAAALAFACLLGLAAPVTSPARQGPLELVDDLDLERYAGLWYEIARLPNEFQDQCAGEVAAEYTLLENGRIRVVNRCRTAGGEFDQAEGRARRPDPQQPAELKVRFAPRWLSWLPFVWGDYQVMALDPDYSRVMIGEPSRTYLWILAREPQLPDDTTEALLDEAARQGFDADRVVRTRQDRQ